MQSDQLEREVDSTAAELAESSGESTGAVKAYLPACVRLVELLKAPMGAESVADKYGLKRDLAIRMRKRVMESLAGAVTEEALHQRISHNRLVDLDYKFSSGWRGGTHSLSPGQELRHREGAMRGRSS